MLQAMLCVCLVLIRGITKGMFSFSWISSTSLKMSSKQESALSLLLFKTAVISSINDFAKLLSTDFFCNSLLELMTKKIR